ncbi:hypothetical protein CBM2586_A10299 [Cupriavidus phytorum]|uniref:Uncharacterized protein n=1 Tax=Cupriavidus taiwanensis TaxID=164546 RepID=A0A375B9R6_9BURK|nr:hypothetical protein CBM2586_A10299 [Cupriavidus taiwanensis]
MFLNGGETIYAVVVRVGLIIGGYQAGSLNKT